MVIPYALWQDDPTLHSVGTPSHIGCSLTMNSSRRKISSIQDDDDIDWKHNPFDVDSVEGPEEDPEQLMSKITFEGSPQLQTRLKALVREFIDVFATKVSREPAAVEPMKIVIDEDKWRLPCNRAPPRKHSEEKQ